MNGQKRAPGHLLESEQLRLFNSTCPRLQEFVALNNLADLPGASKQGKRLGRGVGSGKGKTSGRGHKGQKARRGRQVKIGFEGGQSPLKEYTPKRGFHNPNSVHYQVLNLQRLKQCLDSGKLPSDTVITMKDLRDSGTIQRKIRDGVKILGRGASAFDKQVHLQVSDVSDSAKAAIERCGGSVKTVYYNKLGLRALFMPDWFERKGRLLPRPARPPPKKWDKYDSIGSLPPDRSTPTEKTVTA